MQALAAAARRLRPRSLTKRGEIAHPAGGARGWALAAKGFSWAIGLPFALLLWTMTFAIPRDPRLWAFGSSAGTRFADNAKWLFLHSTARRDITPIWITRSRAVAQRLAAAGLPVAVRGSLKGLWTCLRAGVYAFDVNPDDIDFRTSRGALTVNLWHGIPLKKIERDIDTPGQYLHRGLTGGWLARLVLWARAPWLFGTYGLVCSTAPAISRVMASAFGVPPCHTVETGLPRNDALFASHPADEMSAPVHAARRAGKKILFFMPTFRDSQRPYLFTAAEQRVLDRVLERANATLFVKLHPIDRSRWVPVADAANIIVLHANMDVYEVLGQADLLISDYSSVMFDYLLLDRPVLLYCHDLDSYLAHDRGFYFDYDAVAAGPRLADFTALTTELEATLAGRDHHAQARARVRAMLHSHPDASSCARTFAAIRRHGAA